MFFSLLYLGFCDLGNGNSSPSPFSPCFSPVPPNRSSPPPSIFLSHTHTLSLSLSSQNLSGLLNLVPSLTDELLQRIDQPLTLSPASPSSRPYILCDYNRDGDSYRSPWTNTYSPPLPDGFQPAKGLRELEVKANAIFDSYRELYFEGGVSSVYLWETSGSSASAASADKTIDCGGGFAGCFLIKKDVAGSKNVKEGSWNSIHVVEVGPAVGGKATYKLTTTIMLSAKTDAATPAGATSLAGSLTRQTAQTLPVGAATGGHIPNVGRMIEDMETDMRVNMDNLYIQKTREVVAQIRNTAEKPKQGKDHTAKLNEAVMTHGAGRKIDSEE